MRVVFLWVLLIPLAACAIQQRSKIPAVARAEIESGRMIAENKCAACHAIGMTGDSPFRLAPPFRLLSERYPIKGLEEALAEGNVKGHPAMPEWIFEPTEIRGLLGYIESVQER